MVQLQMSLISTTIKHAQIKTGGVKNIPLVFFYIKSDL